MTNYNFGQLENIWIEGGGSSQMAPMMAAIALAASGGNPTALNPNDNNGQQSSYGLWQISNGTHAAPSANWSDPVTNAQLAVQKLSSQGLGAWGTYTSGRYMNYLPTSLTSYAEGIASNPKMTGAQGSAAYQNGATASKGSTNVPISGLGADATILAYIDRALNPSYATTSFGVFSLNLSTFGKLMGRGLGVIFGVGILYIGMKGIGEDPLRSATSVIGLGNEIQRTRQAGQRLGISQQGLELGQSRLQQQGVLAAQRSSYQQDKLLYQQQRDAQRAQEKVQEAAFEKKKLKVSKRRANTSEINAKTNKRKEDRNPNQVPFTPYP